MNSSLLSSQFYIKRNEITADILFQVILCASYNVLIKFLQMQVETQHYDFYNDIKKVCQKSTDCHTVQKSKIDDCIRSIAKREGYISCDITIKAIPSNGDNYLADLHEIDVKGKTADGDKETAIFVKTIAANASTMEILSIPGVYKAELFFYKELLNIYNELQNDGNIPVNERFNMLKGYEESHDEAIFMENLARKGLKTLPRIDVVSLSMAEESIKQLARFHGLSLVLENKRPDYFAKKIRDFEASIIFNDVWYDYAEKYGRSGLDYLDADVKKKIENKILGIMKKMPDYIGNKSIKYCLCHGDYKPTNIMVKEMDGKVTEAIPVDYQLIYYGCPVLDFLYFVYSSTDRQFRKDHVVHLKNLYFQTLDHFLHHFDMSAESVYPRNIFEKQYDEMLDYGLIVLFLYGPFFFVSENETAPNIANEKIMEMEFKTDDRFKDRLREAIEEFLELGYL